jgi:actin beta/gamma 1
MTEPVVIDAGSRWIRGGFAGEDAPRAMAPCVLGKSNGSTKYFGDEAITSKREKLRLHHPIQRGVITNWDDMQTVWHFMFYNELRIAPEEHAIFLTEPPLQSKQDREKMTEVMFEYFYTPALHIANTAELALFASDRVTGIVLQSGESTTHAVPIYNGHALPQATCSIDLGGAHLTEYLAKFCRQDHGFDVTPGKVMEIVRDMKEMCCYVASDTTPLVDKSYEVYEGSFIITLGDTSYKCTEPLFKPKLADVDACGIHELIVNSIRKCDPSIRDELYSNIILSGGNTMFKGLQERLTKEITTLAPSSARVEVVALPERKHLSWIGGSLVSCLYENTKWITQELYYEYGPEVVHIKCPQSSFQAEALSSPKIMFNQKTYTDVDLYR